MLTEVALAFLAVVCYCHASLPITAPSAVIGRQSSRSCPPQDDLEAAKHYLTQNISDNILDTVLPSLQGYPPCRCDPQYSWRNVAFLDVNLPQSCPSSWKLTTSPVRGCGRLNGDASSCDAVIYPSKGIAFSRVCGRIIAIQKGNTNAFWNRLGNNLEGPYIDGVSLTHGQPGSREHVWSFANAYYDQSVDSAYASDVCGCMYPNWQNIVPSFVANNYFCATGSRSKPIPDQYYTDDPLWDGVGCPATSTCCMFNQPPWFCTTLSNPTTDDIEVRICGDENTLNEDTLVTNIEIYVK